MEEEKLISFDNLIAVLNEYGKAVEEQYKTNLINSDRKASGELINSVDYIYTHSGNTFEVSLKLKEWWKWVEYNTRPHFPPINKILEWVRIKPVLPHPDKNGKLPTEKQLAFLIARKISEAGTEGSHDLSNTLDNINSIYTEKIMNALNEDLDKGVGLILQTII